MSLGGVPIRIANMQFSNLYPSRRSTIISVYSGAFSASSIIYVAIEHIYTGVSISFFWANFILVAISLLMIPFTLFILPPDRIRENGSLPPKSPKMDHNHNNIQNVDQLDTIEKPLSNDLFPRKKSIFAISPITLQNYKSVKSPIVQRRSNSFINHGYLNDVDNDRSYGKGAILNRQLSMSNESELNIKANIDDENNSLNQSPPLWISLSSFAYNLHQMWFSWMITYMLLYVGSMGMWTERVTTDRSHQSSFINLYGIVQVLALVISPMAGLLMDWQLTRANTELDPLERRVKRVQSGFWPLFITSVTLLICVLCHYFDTAQVIYTSIVFITIYRAFLLAVGSAFLRIRFHGDHFNRLLGIMSSVSAVISLLQIPLFKWEGSASSNVLYVNIFNTILALLIMSNPIYLMITPLQRYFIRKEDEQMKKAAIG
ncbi:hypothetical protein RDWZM_000687 [Blomia tropicalis]|uniref:Uncharacterized protein n=1 Tax=Blomia tropicalis TaxID=40697 RepID=A0A9Q0MAT7_BLOTA|nr:hypothetical protein RDWZM_000687 [Blomia tropicalis]